MRSADSPRRRGLERRKDVEPRGLERGCETEEDARQERQRRRRGQHASVQIGPQRKAAGAAREEQREDANAALREGYAEDAPERGQEHALGEELSYEAETARADADPERHLPRACRRAGEEE